MEKFKKALIWFKNSYIWLFILFFAIDIISKNLVVKNMEPEQSIPLIKGFLHITYRINPAAAFSLGFGNNVANLIIYSIIALSVSIGIVIYYIKNQSKLSAYIKACLMLVLVGALGNLVDRLFYNASYLKGDVSGVVDFIDFCGIWDAVFNIADSCVVIAAFMFIGLFIYEEVKDHQAKVKKFESHEKAISNTEKMMQNEENNKKN